MNMQTSFVTESWIVHSRPIRALRHPGVVAIALVLLACALGYSQDRGKLIWADEFDYTGAPDSKRWTNEVGFIRNGEAQFYTARRPENARVENGKLVIEARRESFTIPPDARGRRGRTNAEYTSASLTTQGLGE